MRNFVRALGNTTLVIGGFLVVFFGVSKVLNSSKNSHSEPLTDGTTGIAYADAPAADSGPGDSAQSSDSGDSGDSSGDSGGK